MPLSMNRPVIPAQIATGANVQKLTIDVASKRIIVDVIYGEIISGQFRRRTDYPGKRYVLDGADFDTLANQRPAAGLSLYNVIKNAVWNTLISKGWESGSIV